MQPRGKRILIGCGIGCLAVIVLGVASCAAFVVWINRPGELLEPDLLVGGDTCAYAAWTLRLEDPGTAEFVQAMLEATDRVSRRNQGDIPPGLANLLNNLQQKRNRKQVNELFPLVVAWTAHPGSGPDEDLHLFTVSLQQAGNQIVFWDWIMGMMLGWFSDLPMTEHRGEKIFNIADEGDERFAFFIRGNDIFFTSDLDTARQAVDRLSDGPAGNETAGDLQALLAGVPDRSALRGAIGNRRGELDRVWRQLTDGGGLPDGLRAATLTGGLAGADSLQATLRFRCADAGQAQAEAPELAALIESALEPLELPVATGTAVEGEWVRIDVTLDGITESIERFLSTSSGAGRIRTL
jgi:hypothetical protein